MSVNLCTHIKVTGVRCGSPALRGEQRCYFHQRVLRTVRHPAARVHAAALVGSPAIQASLREVISALIRGTIDVKRAKLILRALNTAARNARRLDVRASEAIREVPQFESQQEPRSRDAASESERATPRYFGGYVDARSVAIIKDDVV